ncbi:uncharacterized protein YALI1_C22944g [Yarrowia lipolytica]|uniref:Uncharacterized protein n=1 Tax=Yarrowia lipolytica TaxID=4952 RepID=A0A1D8NBE0_YARLL|nr:hypothetical protein YALI1_C22944g [Yarrowia lipolytica]
MCDHSAPPPPDSLAKRYGADKEPLIKSCFTKVDYTNQFLESYITHVSSHRGLTSPSARVIIAVRKNVAECTRSKIMPMVHSRLERRRIWKTSRR